MFKGTEFSLVKLMKVFFIVRLYEQLCQAAFLGFQLIHSTMEQADIVDDIRFRQKKTCLKLRY